MSTHSGTGMSTYERILQEARVSGKEIGPKHHLHDKQKQEWAKTNIKVIDKTAAGVLKSKVTEAAAEVKKTTQQASKVVASIRVPIIPAKQDLREKLRKENLRKLADSLKANDRTDHIKSVGNGL